MINATETTHNQNEIKVYFYQMCGRRASDKVTLSDGNVSSCVCRCNKTSVGFLSSCQLIACVSSNASRRSRITKISKPDACNW